MTGTSICSKIGCRNAAYARSMCRRHYTQFLAARPAPSKPRSSDNSGSNRWYMENVVLPYADKQSCLIWPFAKGTHGYGHYCVGGLRTTASRAVCILTHGHPTDASHEAAHSCGKGKQGCVNPHHIRWATPAENTADKVLHGTIPRGENGTAAKLKHADVLQIRQRVLAGQISQRSIAKEYGVAQSSISRIVSGENWGLS